MATFLVEKRGYSTTQVDNYIKQIEAEKASLEAQLKVFATQEDTIKRCIINAQATADETIKDAQDQARALIASANKEADQIIRGAQAKLDAAHTQLDSNKYTITRFQNELQAVLIRCTESIKSIDTTDLVSTIDEMSEKLDEFEASEKWIGEDTASDFSEDEEDDEFEELGDTAGKCNVSSLLDINRGSKTVFGNEQKQVGHSGDKVTPKQLFGPKEVN